MSAHENPVSLTLNISRSKCVGCILAALPVVLSALSFLVASCCPLRLPKAPRPCKRIPTLRCPLPRRGGAGLAAACPAPESTFGPFSALSVLSRRWWGPGGPWQRVEWPPCQVARRLARPGPRGVPAPAHYTLKTPLHVDSVQVKGAHQHQLRSNISF